MYKNWWEKFVRLLEVQSVEKSLGFSVLALWLASIIKLNLVKLTN